MITLRHCLFSKVDGGCWTAFPDGTGFGATPHPEMHHYSVIAHRLGYGDDHLAYCVEHEAIHNFLEDRLHDRPSQVIWALAHGKPLSGRAAAYEEMAVQTFQRFLRSNERPILSGVDWDSLKREALQLLGDL